MDAAAKTAKLEEYRAVIGSGGELSQQQFVLYQGLEAWEARTAAAPAQAIAPPAEAFTTPSPNNRCKTPRSSQKQDSFKNKLLRRRLFKADTCQICNEAYTGCESAHIFDVAYAKELNQLYLASNSEDIPISVNDAVNGILLCPNCHKYFDHKERYIKIKRDGTIVLSGQPKEDRYKELDNKKVPWHKNIGKPNWPSAGFLEFVFKWKKTKAGKRKRDLEYESDDENDVPAGKTRRKK